MLPPNPNQPTTLTAVYFDAVYNANTDPWGFETSPYEKAKYARSLAALPAKQFQSALEIGCSLGVLTEQLAARCDKLLAVDIASAALEKARQRCAHLPQVELQLLHIPDQFPANLTFDLAVLSEVGYYWSPADLVRAADLVIGSLRQGGNLLLVHWTPPVHDYPLTGDQVHEYFLTRALEHGELHHLGGERHETYRLDILERT